GPLNVHPVLIRTRQVRHVVSAHPLVTRDHVAHNRGVRRPDVRPRVRVIDWRGNVKLRFRHSTCELLSAFEIQTTRQRSLVSGGFPSPPRAAGNLRTPASRSAPNRSSLKSSCALRRTESRRAPVPCPALFAARR